MNQLLSSIKYVMHHPDHVHIDPVEIDRYVDNFEEAKIDHWMGACPFDYHPLKKEEDEIDRWFLADALAFCFWGNPYKWTIEYQNKKFDGWWALLASFQRALENDTFLLDGNFLSSLSFEQAQELFAGESEIPLFGERLEILHNIGNVLIEKYKGRFHHFLKDAPHDAIQFIQALIVDFPTFDDVSIYKGEKVFFYKKAQLLVHDLVTGFPKSSLVNIAGLDQLTGEADYKIPALLRSLGILTYSKSLAKKVDNRTYIPADSPEEIEIRAGMLWACHLICEKLNKHGININPITLDGILWVQSQTKLPGSRPYHLTLTTDY